MQTHNRMYSAFVAMFQGAGRVMTPVARTRPPGPDEVLVKIAAAGLCYSDLSAINGDRLRPTPIVLGHECSGVVEEIRPGAIDLKPGDRVVMSFLPTCGHCPSCMDGRAQL